MTRKNSWHSTLLMTTAISIGCVTAYSLINSEVGNRSLTNFTFPPEIPLAAWQSLGNQNIEIKTSDTVENEDVIQSASRYQYRDGDTQVEIEMYYVTETRGNIDKLLQEQTQIAPESLKKRQTKQQDGNYYTLFSDRDRSYLSSCLNATGYSIVDQKQFSATLNQRLLNIELLGNWLLGKASIRDRRCLWVTISTPNNDSSFLQPSDLLEQVWQEWYQWWQPRFPDL